MAGFTKGDMCVKPGGGITTKVVSGTTKAPNRPTKASAKPSMHMGPYGGKKPA